MFSNLSAGTIIISLADCTNHEYCMDLSLAGPVTTPGVIHSITSGAYTLLHMNTTTTLAMTQINNDHNSLHETSYQHNLVLPEG